MNRPATNQKLRGRRGKSRFKPVRDKDGKIIERVLVVESSSGKRAKDGVQLVLRIRVSPRRPPAK